MVFLLACPREVVHFLARKLLRRELLLQGLQRAASLADLSRSGTKGIVERVDRLLLPFELVLE
jgi:hypothetical protein